MSVLDREGDIIDSRDVLLCEKSLPGALGLKPDPGTSFCLRALRRTALSACIGSSRRWFQWDRAALSRLKSEQILYIQQLRREGLLEPDRGWEG